MNQVMTAGYVLLGSKKHNVNSHDKRAKLTIESLDLIFLPEFMS